MRCASPILRSAVGLLALAVGCQSSGQPSGGLTGGGGAGGTNSGNFSSGGGGNFWDDRPGREGSLTGGRRQPDPEVSGVLAGQILDSFGRRPSSAIIQVSTTDGGGAPLEVEADQQGYFLVQGLNPGRTYILTARAKDSGQLLTGEAQARPPFTRLVIRVTSDAPSATTPPIPSAPAGQPPEPDRPPAKSSDPLTGPTAGDRSWAPGRSMPPPDPSPNPAPNPNPPPASPSSIAAQPTAPNPLAPRPASVPSPYQPPTTSPAPKSAPDAFGPRSELRPQMGEVVPACSIVNDRVTTLTLTDLDGRTWDFHRDHTGRLVLIDFWGTWCVPCLRAVPLLNSLESAYGRYGLQVVGIACERDERSPSERARRVSEVVEKMKIRYKVLLAEDRERDPVQRQFRIREYPYLVLLDGEGNILWRGGSSGLRELEAILHRRLNAP